MAHRKQILRRPGRLLTAGAASIFAAGIATSAWSATPTIYNLGTLGGTSSSGYGINASGQVAGQSLMAGNATAHAFRYTGTPGSGGAMSDLGTLGGTNSSGNAINASGQVAGDSGTAGDASQHAFRTAPNAAINAATDDLGTLGGTHSWGRAINAGGQVAGFSDTAGDAAFHAFLYTGTPGVDGQMTDLDAWLDANNPAEGAKWTLYSAYGLSDAGLITGGGDYNDGPGGLSDGGRAYLLDASSLAVPEPSSLSLLALAGVGLLRRRRTSR